MANKTKVSKLVGRLLKEVKKLNDEINNHEFHRNLFYNLTTFPRDYYPILKNSYREYTTISGQKSKIAEDLIARIDINDIPFNIDKEFQREMMEEYNKEPEEPKKEEPKTEEKIEK